MVCCNIFIRHSNNMLLTTSGNVFHIDFGKYLGDWQMAAGFKGDRVPFIFTPDMEFVIKNCLEEGSDGYHYFVNDCCDAFNLIRKNCSILLNALKLMKSSGIPLKVGETDVKKNEVAHENVKHETLKATPNGKQQLVTVKIWSKPWEDFEEITIEGVKSV
uniref:PI3K/PI4K domain-containing protein n=1 Tax=Rhabditophanes sp. KR3021 TaxID=114890 RepID=A0AC35UFB9_9BILA